MRAKIGIIGAGYVGGAIASALSDCDVAILDQDPSRGKATYAEVKTCRGIFVCVSSPTTDDGRCDTSNLESVLEKLEGYTGVIISKVTAPPDVYEGLNKRYPNLVYSPEFLTAANAIVDYMRTPFIIVGGSVIAYCNEAVRLIEMSLGREVPTQICSIAEAAFIKYLMNSYLATKAVLS